MDAERKLISLQVKYDTLEKTHFTVKQQMKKMKVGRFQSVCVCVGVEEEGGGKNIFRLLHSYCTAPSVALHVPTFLHKNGSSYFSRLKGEKFLITCLPMHH